MKIVYIVLCVLGVVLPYYFILPMIIDNQLDFLGMFEYMFKKPISAFFIMDLLVSSVVFWIFMIREAIRRKVKLWWICIIANILVGLSFALPLFLLMREIKIEKN